MRDSKALEIANNMRARHSTRVPFDPLRRIPDEDLQAILEAARWAPTPHNMQNFDVIVVDDRTVLAQIGAVYAPTSAVFLRENYQQLSFSEEETAGKGTGLLGGGFP